MNKNAYRHPMHGCRPILRMPKLRGQRDRTKGARLATLTRKQERKLKNEGEQ